MRRYIKKTWSYVFSLSALYSSHGYLLCKLRHSLRSHQMSHTFYQCRDPQWPKVQDSRIKQLTAAYIAF